MNAALRIVDAETAGDASLAQRINDAHRRAKATGLAFLEDCRRAGELLWEAKEQAGHGNFMRWIVENIDCSYRTCRSYMVVARDWDRIKSAGAATLAEATAKVGGLPDPDEPEDDPQQPKLPGMETRPPTRRPFETYCCPACKHAWSGDAQAGGKVAKVEGTLRQPKGRWRVPAKGRYGA